jgi:site-specific DNA-methyltransferase (adenine-specific)
MNALYYGDNLAVLRESIKDETVDLIYLDPPFNSNASYNVLFKTPTGEQSQAQIEAFEDTWHWNEHAERAFDDVMNSGNSEAANMLNAMRSFLGENDMMAYLAMMAVRLIELHRVLKPTGSLYLHCDPVASHYLKILLDSIFEPTNFRSEIIWKRTTAHSNVYSAYGDITDTIFFFSKRDDWTWNQLYRHQTKEDIEKAFPNMDFDGRRWRSENMRNPGVRPNLHYPYKASTGTTYLPHPNGWTVNLERMKALDAAGLLHFPAKPEGRLRFKLYADKSPGIKLQNLWDDISAIGAQAQERLGYPTQKPLALLERIIAVPSNENDLVLDPFCGCGTATHAAEKLHRRWIGIDITHLAIGLIERRLTDAFSGIRFEVHGTPKDFAGAEDLAKRDKFQFQWWAVTLINAVPYGGKKKGADTGIDGYYYCKPDGKKTEAGIVSVKGGETVHRNAVGELRGVVERDKAPLGVLITLRDPTGPMKAEAAAAGFLETPFGKFQRLQVVTIGNLLEGKIPKLPPQEIGGGFKQAPQEKPTQSKLL